MKHLFVIALAIGVGSGCAQLGEPHVHESGDRVASVVLSGDALVDELATSPVREAAPFARIGLMWQAESAASFEISVSADGQSWSEWRAPEVFGAEVEAIASFVGQVGLDPDGDGDGELAGFYRLRATDSAAPAYVVLEFLEQTLVEAIEDGEVFDQSSRGESPETLAITVGGADVNSRASWGAKAPKCVSSHSPDRFTIHHTVTPNNDSQSPEARIRGIQRYHQDVRGWCDIGYQYLVSQDGRLWEGRGAARLGSHVGGGNRNNVGISFIGDYMNVRPTDVQVDAAGALIAGLSDQYGISLSSDAKVKGHRDQGQTSCPGDALYARLGDIRAAARGGGATPPPPPPPPTSGATTVKGVVYIGSDTSQRVAGATVTLGAMTTTTNSAGYYELAGVTDASFTATARADGFAPSGVTRSATGSVTWASISMSRATGTAILQGVVYRGSNSANRVAGATVELSSGVVAQTDENGFYRLDQLAPGSVTISAVSGSDQGSVSRTLENGSVTWGSVSL